MISNFILLDLITKLIILFNLLFIIILIVTVYKGLYNFLVQLLNLFLLNALIKVKALSFVIKLVNLLKDFLFYF